MDINLLDALMELLCLNNVCRLFGKASCWVRPGVVIFLEQGVISGSA